MDRHQQSEAIILKADPVGEIHKSLALLSPSLGLIYAMAHGARSAKGRLKGLSLPFMAGNFYLYLDPVRKSWKITDVAVGRMFEGVRGDLDKFYAASFMAELVLKSYGGDPAAVHRLLLEALAALEGGRPGSFREPLLRFIWRYLAIAGLQPSTEHCAGCGLAFRAPVRGGIWYDPLGAGFVCGGCRGEHAAALPAGSLEYLETIPALGFEPGWRAEPDEKGLFALSMILFRLIETSLGIKSVVLENGKDILKSKSQ